MSRIRNNVSANILGQVVSAGLQLLVVPIYIRFLGIDGYGLVGVYVTLQAVLQVFDLGLTPTINRELARYVPGRDDPATLRNLIRTLEIGYWGIGIVIGIGIFALAPLVSTHWVKSNSIPPDVVKSCVRIMAFLALLQWPVTLYHGGLMGLQRQVTYNVVKIVCACIANLGGVLVLWMIAKTPGALFMSQAIAMFIQVSWLGLALWKAMPQAVLPPRPQFSLIRQISGFASSAGLLAISALLVNQLDKVIVSRFLTLQYVGYYTVAWSVASALYMLSNPFYYALFPRFATLVRQDDIPQLQRILHMGVEVMVVIVVSFGAVLAGFSESILALWTRNTSVAQSAAPITSVLVVGAAIAGLVNIVVALQLSYGQVRSGIRINFFLAISLLPSAIIAVHFGGAVAIAITWVFANSVYLLICASAIQKQIGHKIIPLSWILKGILRPTGIACVIVLLVKAYVSHFNGTLNVFSLAIVLLLTIVGTSIMAPEVRHLVLQSLAPLVRRAHVR